MKKVKIQKKDGRIEEFDKEKLKRSIFSAGATKGQSQLVTQEVEEWLYNVALEEIIDTQEIRNKVVGSLTEKNPQAGKSYQEYKKRG
jgi:transcriptional regulator NrdR family protein